jgi:hypothetical protein
VNITRTIRRKFGVSCATQTIGSRGESGAALLIVDVGDVAKTYPNARYSVVAQRVNGPPYPVASNLRAESDQLIWSVDPYVTAQEGKIDIEVQARQGDAVLKGFRWPFFVAASISGKRGHCCDHGRHDHCDDGSIEWVDQLLSRADELDRRIDEVFDALAAADNTELVLEPYPSFDALPAEGLVGKIYLVLTEDGCAELYTYIGDPPSYVQIQNSPHSGASSDSYDEYTSYEDLPGTGTAGMLYLVNNADGTAALYGWTDNPPGYVNLTGEEASTLLPGTIIDCNPVNE